MRSGSLGKRIAELRKQRGYTQKELAQKMGIPWTLMTDYERGKIRLHDELIRKLSIALEISADEILDLKPAPNEVKPSLRIVRRVSKIESLPSSKQKALLQIIDGFLQSQGK
jgi:transcriptional regulator with XRE-family HTH domain